MINILITGDFCPINRIQGLMEKEEYFNIYNEFLPLIKEADLAITNLECPIINGGVKITKTGPNLKAAEKAIKALAYAGFNLVTLANNHIMDYGTEGLNSTLEFCKNSYIDIVGAGYDLTEARKPFYKSINNIKLAFVNFCENEWSTTTGNSPGANPINLVTNYYDIKDAKANSDYVIVIVHGGHENYQLPSPRMQETYRFFIDSGADAVIGHHSHCYSGFEIYHGNPIFYSLGNFIFDWPGNRNSLWNKGYAVLFTIIDDRIDFTLHPFVQGDQNPGLRLIYESEKKLFEEQVTLLNQYISDSKKLETHFQDFLQTVQKRYLSYLEPYSNRYLSALYNRGLLPSCISVRKKRFLLNLIRCEAHRDLLIRALND